MACEPVKVPRTHPGLGSVGPQSPGGLDLVPQSPIEQGLVLHSYDVTD